MRLTALMVAALATLSFTRSAQAEAIVVTKGGEFVKGGAP